MANGALGDSIFGAPEGAIEQKHAPATTFLRLCRTSEPQKDPIAYNSRRLPRWPEIKAAT